MVFKIVHSIHSINPAHGGTTEAVRLLAGGELASASHVISSDEPGLQFGRDWACGSSFAGPSKTKLGWSPRWKALLRTQLQSADALIIHGMWQYHAWVSASVAQQMQVPYFVFPHGMLDPWAMRQSRLRKTIAWRLFNRSVLANAAGMCYTTLEEQTLAGQFLGDLPITPLQTPLGVEDPQVLKNWDFEKATPGLTSKRTFLFLGRLHPKKGCDLLIRAFAQWKAQSSDSGGVHLRLAGPCDSPGYLNELKTLAADLGLKTDGDVSFPGMVSGLAKWQELARAEVMILPSHQENFALVVAESLACGVPVLLSHNVNTASAVVGGAAGIADTDTWEGTLRMIEAWAALSLQERRLMAGRARRLYLQKFSADSARSHFRTVIQEAVTGWKDPS